MRALHALAVIGLSLVLLAPSASAQNEVKKKKGAAPAANTFSKQVLKTLEVAKLSDEETTKVKEKAEKVDAEVKKLYEAGGVTPEALKELATVTKEARDAKKTPKEVKAARDEVLGKMTEEQQKAIKDADAAMTKCRKEIFESLTAEQKAALPEQIQKNWPAGGAQANNKKAA